MVNAFSFSNNFLFRFSQSLASLFRRGGPSSARWTVTTTPGGTTARSGSKVLGGTPLASTQISTDSTSEVYFTGFIFKH